MPSRVVNLSSLAHFIFAPRPEGILWDDMVEPKSYNPWERYGLYISEILNNQARLKSPMFCTRLSSTDATLPKT
jgi:hypothetical protein